MRNTQGRDLRHFNEGPVGSEPDFPSPDLHENDDGTQHPVMAGLEADVTPPSTPAIDE